ncbi:ABC transporter [Methylosinus sp. R-45379]|jgi:capsular polysaccharide transport system permease protein|uniref:ABC transporter permease n=1 Tax=unclassified Methylosinus TaxID=2624500 RepID=UPI0004678D39|nr:MULTISPECIES: ABC transporter permease [unclassified Methylosinus]OAI25738.1 ABC transporter [Methylosinus sp. R-45379]
MYATQSATSEFRDAFRRQRLVLFALMLRNIRTRFFGHGLGYLVAIAWPLVHTLVIILLFVFNSRMAPVGESTLLFVATGAVPFQVQAYLSTFMMMSVLQSRPLFAFPEVKVMDALISSILLEILSSCTVVLILLILGSAFGENLAPRDIEQAALAYAAAIILGVGIGFFNGTLALAMPMWALMFSLLRILLWFASGTVFLPDNLPEPYRTMQSYNPIAQSIEWMRYAYYDGVGAGFLDRAYVLEFGVGMIFVSLLIERMTRGHLLSLR